MVELKKMQIQEKTCKNTSLIDYVIASPDLFVYINEFDVLEFDPILSR